MTDLEMTALCADAMGHTPEVHQDRVYVYDRESAPFGYDPLQNDEEAMALVKKFQLWISSFPEEGWRVQYDATEKDIESINRDLNRAIVECVALMQAAIRTDSALAQDE